MQSGLLELPMYLSPSTNFHFELATDWTNSEETLFWDTTDEKNKMHGLCWDNIFLPKMFGGLGVKKAPDMKITILRKWFSRFSQNAAGLWRTVITKSKASSLRVETSNPY